jgi:hypothetical protein
MHTTSCGALYVCACTSCRSTGCFLAVAGSSKRMRNSQLQEPIVRQMYGAASMYYASAVCRDTHSKLLEDLLRRQNDVVGFDRMPCATHSLGSLLQAAVTGTAYYSGNTLGPLPRVQEQLRGTHKSTQQCRAHCRSQHSHRLQVSSPL